MFKLTFLLASAIVIAQAAPATNPAGWVVGKIGQNCNAVCASMGGKACFERSLNTVPDIETFKSIYPIRFAGSRACAMRPVNKVSWAPGVNSRTYACYANGLQQSTCAASPPPFVRRICCCGKTPCPPDFNNCQVSEWAPFSGCTQSCGAGTQQRTRDVTQTPTSNGEACPALTESKACNTDPCPVDCVVSEWSGYDDCTEPCGTGEQTRTRDVDVAAVSPGNECPDLSETIPCNTDPCPDCDSQTNRPVECTCSTGGQCQSGDCDVDLNLCKAL